MYLSRPPQSAALAPFVDTIQYVEDVVPHDRERLIPTGDVLLLMTLDGEDFTTFDEAGREHSASGCAVVGPASRPSVVSTSPQRGMVAVSFKLGAAAAFLGLPAAAMRDTVMPLCEVWGRYGATGWERVLSASGSTAKMAVLEEIMVEQLVRTRQPDSAVIQAAAELGNGASVRSVVETFGITAKPFIRRFEDHIGMPPKRFSRVRRLQRTLAAAAEDSSTDWARLAADNGYYDQSHLIHDFGELAGVTPGRFRPRSSSEWNHQPV